ncbi:hypothetical protein OGH69_15085 [Flavobacterium sp. MFBS3-15]|uniref:hypothetical protein n=1 Tax=Flavobacterium sp. MFBS3-15 TaxID=2989816 RepID=UPI002236A8E3|nr:hypothetical protein [Flavobacterium sp. MFBS3-15]MCW4470298.1 hypothetical protein [Flavobacterium sp. MFBS3-15]
MKVSRILINGLIIFIGIAAFFLIMESAGLKDQIYLRLINFIFVIYGVNRTIKGNFKDRIDGYFTNLAAGFLTSFISLVLGIFSFMLYAEYKGGTDYLQNFPHSYIFGGGEPEIGEFCFGLFLEGLAASMIVSFALMQFWKDKLEKINEVDDVAHRPH